MSKTSVHERVCCSKQCLPCQYGWLASKADFWEFQSVYMVPSGDCFQSFYNNTVILHHSQGVATETVAVALA